MTSAGEFDILGSSNGNALDILGEILEGNLVEGGSAAECGVPIGHNCIVACVWLCNKDVSLRIVGRSRSILGCGKVDLIGGRVIIR